MGIAWAGYFARMAPLDFSDLVSYHKQEGAEEMTYLTIIFTVACLPAGRC